MNGICLHKEGLDGCKRVTGYMLFSAQVSTEPRSIAGVGEHLEPVISPACNASSSSHFSAVFSRESGIAATPTFATTFLDVVDAV